MFKNEEDFNKVLNIDYHEIQTKQIYLRVSNSRQDMKKGKNKSVEDEAGGKVNNPSVASMERQFNLLAEMDYRRKLEIAVINPYNPHIPHTPINQYNVPVYNSEKYIRRQNPYGGRAYDPYYHMGYPFPPPTTHIPYDPRIHKHPRPAYPQSPYPYPPHPMAQAHIPLQPPQMNPHYQSPKYKRAAVSMAEGKWPKKKGFTLP